MRVLLIHDPLHDVQAVRAALAPDGVVFEASTSMAMAAGITQQASVDAVLVSVRSMDDPKINLARAWRTEALYDGLLILLCPGRIAEDAYRLCREGVFDDYAFVEPLHDGFRLRLALHKAVASRVNEKAQMELAALSHVVADARGAASGAAGQLNEDWKEVLPLLRRMLQEWEQSRLGGESNAVGRSEERAGLMTVVERIRQRQEEAWASVDDHVDLIDRSLARARAPDGRLLVLVDDDPAFTEIFDIMVSALGYHLKTSADPRTALRLIKEVHPVVVLLDVDMPGMSGIELLRTIRSDKIVGTIPVILMTGRRDIDTVMMAKQLRVNGYLVKPASANEIAAKLDAIVGQARP